VRVFQPRRSQEKISENRPETPGQNGQNQGKGGFVRFVPEVPGVSEKKIVATPVIGDTGTEYPEPRDTGISSPVIPGSLERLPSELEALIRAASSDTLPAGSITLESGLCADLNRHVLAWGCAYLLHSPDALPRLWTAHRAWRVHLERVLN
jgi:hypothetical protein